MFEKNSRMQLDKLLIKHKGHKINKYFPSFVQNIEIQKNLFTTKRMPRNRLHRIQKKTIKQKEPGETNRLLVL
jgi:hypothetical protein